MRSKSIPNDSITKNNEKRKTRNIVNNFYSRANKRTGVKALVKNLAI